MKLYKTAVFLLLSYSTVFIGVLHAQGRRPGYTDYHVHLQDSATVQLNYLMAKAFHQPTVHSDSVVFNADTIIARLNRAHFQSAWILSNSYLFGSPYVKVDNEYEAVKRENDWIATQARHYPGRLKAFMSVNPLKPYALTEIQRCINTGRFAGLKLHFANSQVNLFDESQLKKLQKVFALANKNKLPMLVHFRSSEKWDSRANTRILLNKLLPLTKNTTVVLAHLAGWGGYDRPTDDALGQIATWLHQKGGRSNVYLDVSAVFPLDLTGGAKGANWQPLPALNTRIKQIGTEHLVFGTDFPLIDMGAYADLLKRNLGEKMAVEILGNRVGVVHK